MLQFIMTVICFLTQIKHLSLVMRDQSTIKFDVLLILTSHHYSEDRELKRYMLHSLSSELKV